MRQLLGVRVDDLMAAVPFESFAGLPNEEVERLHDAIALLPLDDAAVTAGAQLPLWVALAVHHNYRWLVHVPERRALRSLVVATPMVAQSAGVSSFLGAEMVRAARAIADGFVGSPGDFTLRCVGLVRTDGPERRANRFAVVYVARLHRRAEECLAPTVTNIALCGNGELEQQREVFDAESRILIDNLTAA